MERKTYNQELVDRVAKYEANMANPEITSEQAAILAKEKHWQELAKHQLRTLDLIVKIEELEGEFIPHSECVLFANYIMKNLPLELSQNIDEWIDDKPLTDIKLNGKSVRDVMEQFGEQRKISFIDAVECLSKWKASGYKNENYCRIYFTSV